MNNRDTYKLGEPPLQEDLSTYADEMVDTIRAIIKQELNLAGLASSSSAQLSGAVVSKVNEDGSVDIYFPPDNTGVFTRISNQTGFPLYVGDFVEIMLKDGSFSNCWVCAKHLEKSGNIYIKEAAKSDLEKLDEKIDDNFDTLAERIKNVRNFTTLLLENAQQVNNAEHIEYNKKIEKLEETNEILSKQVKDLEEKVRLLEQAVSSNGEPPLENP